MPCCAAAVAHQLHGTGGLQIYVDDLAAPLSWLHPYGPTVADIQSAMLGRPLLCNAQTVAEMMLQGVCRYALLPFDSSRCPTHSCKLSDWSPNTMAYPRTEVHLLL